MLPPSGWPVSIAANPLPPEPGAPALSVNCGPKDIAAARIGGLIDGELFGPEFAAEFEGVIAANEGQGIGDGIGVLDFI